MKLSLLFIFSMVFVMQANTAFSQKKITLNLENVTIKHLIDQIELKTEYRFVYKLKDVDLYRKISINVVQEPVSNVLTQAFELSQTDHNIIESQVFLVKKTTNTLKENTIKVPKKVQQKITGKVVDENNEPLPGVTILVKKTKKGTSTNLDGTFSIAANPNDVLVFSYLGYKTEEVTLQNQNTINIQMKEDATALDEVVISTGIFKRKANSFTGSTITVTKEELKRVGNANLFQTIRNLDPSIAIFDNFELGSNPNALPDVQIRGTSTLPPEESELNSNLRGNYLRNPNQPLFILNGFESTIEQVLDIDINFIQSVTLLKDAASKAIYGSRGANGVVVIETQRLSGAKSRITYNTNLDVVLPDLTSYDLTNAAEKLEAERIDGVYTRNSGDPDELVRLQQLYNFRRKLILEGLDTDWLAKPLQTGIGQRHSLSAEFGSESLRMLANVSYNDVAGVMKGSGRKTISGGITAFYRTKNLAFTNRTNIISNKAEESPYGAFGLYTRMNPYWRANNPDGSIPFYSEVISDDIYYTNPLYNATIGTKLESTYLNVINNLYIEWDISPEFRATTRIGIDAKRNDADEFLPSDHTSFDIFDPGGISDERRRRAGSYQVNNGKSMRLSGDFNLQFNKTVNKHTFFTNVGFNAYEYKFSEVVHKVEGFPSGQSNIIFGRDYALGSRPTGIDAISRELGFLGTGSYVYDNRFLSDVTLRTNASSQFGADNRWATFWSLGLGWNLHNEKFFKSDAIKQLRLRGTLGSTGNQNFNANASVATYSYYLEKLYQNFNGSFLDRLANNGLQWETKFDYNLGLDARVKGLSLTFEYYESYTENLITDITIPTSTGFNSVKENLGKVKNSGFELNASYLVWSNENSFLTFNVGLFTNKNEIIELSDALESFNEAARIRAAADDNNKPVLFYEDGLSLNTIWAVPSLGIDPATGREVYINRDGNTTFEWDANDMIAAGDSNPTFRGNFGFTTEYKGFGLSVTGRYLGGGQLYNQTLVDRVENVDINFNVDKRVLTGRWNTPGQVTQFKGLGFFNKIGTFTDFTTLTRPTTRFVQDRNELDIAAINVYYEFNKKFLANTKLQRLRLSFNMNEVAKFSSIQIERGTSFPFARTLSFSLAATF
ncbi:SusC/RagA family TonB-linked outer membrane protein [uncultured Polaribacter sp.]|uniref:SusC/RagA family TonB-linked outer membrane protein n=1 Tax=uncultured Polaribacter sp. TaxID=174711 RepID=UPI0026061CD4|nr:SusC/RagA family TonB-linked outer membrane protein [uncultured Polaribacter sp.]